MKIGIIGLGLIGGSIAKALQYNTEHTVLGTDIDRDVLLKAKLLGAVDEELHEQDLEQCDLLIVALYPQDTLDFVRDLCAADGMRKRKRLSLLWRAPHGGIAFLRLPVFRGHDV